MSERLLSLHAMIVVIGLLTYVILSHTLQQRRHPAAAIGWVLVIALVPYIGLPLYLLFGTRKFVPSGVRPAYVLAASDLARDDTWPQQLAAAMGQPPAVCYQNLRIHADGSQAMRSLWELIDSAQHRIDLCSFILGRDTMGNALMARLITKAQAGIRVRLLLDGIGRMLNGWPDLRQLEAAGGQVGLFIPPLHSPLKGRTNLRDHRKMLLIDDAALWCGSRNFAAEYFEGSDGEAPWQDLTFDLRGPLVQQAADLFEHDWAFANDAPPPGETPHVASMAPGPAAQVIASGPDQADDTVHDMLVTACFKARSRILATTPYFVPSDALLMAMSLAARRGVRVDLIMPSQSNHHLADLARHRALRDLAVSGANIWLLPYMLHAKAVIVDDVMALAGSANLDARSLFLNYEMMIAFYDTGDIQRFADWIEQKLAGASRYQARAPGLLRDLTEGLVLWLAFQL